jgi:hypothetical protein
MCADVPYSATDFAKAFSVIVRTSDDIRKIVGPTFRRWRNRDVAKNLDALAFPPRGMREPLKRLMTGTETPEDKALLTNMLSHSATQITQVIADLERARSRVRKQFGINSARELDQIIYDKIGIRDSLAQIADDPESLMETPVEAVTIYKHTSS